MVCEWCVEDKQTLVTQTVLRPCLQGGTVTLARGLKDSPGLQAKFSGRVTLLPETTLCSFHNPLARVTLALGLPYLLVNRA